MICKVKAYCSVTFRAIRYHQGDEFQAANLEEIADIIDQLDIIEDKTNQEEEA